MTGTWPKWPGAWLISAAGEHVILVGLPGSGKSTIGAAVAAKLGWPFVDLDDEIVRHAGRPIASIFAEEGEAAFRALERRATLALRGAPASVVAPGGGWVTERDTVALLRPPSRMAYLKVSPAEAARRLGATVKSRPLLRGDPVAALERLLAARAAAYLSADCVMDTEVLSLQEVTASVTAMVSTAAGG